MSRVKMSQSELLDLSSNVKKQKDNVDAVVRSSNTAVNQTGADWQSTAFTDFKGLWDQNKHILEGLAEALKAWKPQLDKHAEVAGFTNRKFR